jgi:prepilin-type processing-associated H-X9-DG protein
MHSDTSRRRADARPSPSAAHSKGDRLTSIHRHTWKVAGRASGFSFVQLLVVIAIIAVLIAFFTPMIQRMREKANLALCKDHLRLIGIGLIEYARENDGNLPVSATVENPQRDLLQCLAASHCLGNAANYYCPSEEQPGLRYSDQNFKAGIIGYYYYSAATASANPSLSKFLRSGISWPRELNLTMNANSWVMSDIWFSGQPTAHVGYRKGLNYLMLDGSVDFVGESPRQAFH